MAGPMAGGKLSKHVVEASPTLANGTYNPLPSSPPLVESVETGVLLTVASEAGSGAASSAE